MNDKQTADGINAAYEKAVNKLGKWRSVLAGWIWGTGGTEQLGMQGKRDLMDARLALRVELTAVTALLLEKGIFTIDEYRAQVTIEAGEHDKALEQLFKGYRTTDQGIAVDVKVAQENQQALGFPAMTVLIRAAAGGEGRLLVSVEKQHGAAVLLRFREPVESLVLSTKEARMLGKLLLEIAKGAQ